MSNKFNKMWLKEMNSYISKIKKLNQSKILKNN